MIGFIWNIRGVGDDRKKRIVGEAVIDKHVDFLGLQETIKQSLKKMNYTICVVGKIFFGNGLLLEEDPEVFWLELIKII